MTLFYYAALAAIGCYLAARTYFILWRFGKGVRLGAAAFALVSSLLYPLLMVEALGHPWESMHAVLSVVGFFFTAASFSAILLFLTDAARVVVLVATLFRKRGRLPGAFYAALFAIASALALWGGINVKTLPPVRETAVTVPGLPAALSGLRIVHLSDIHVSPLFEKDRFEEIARRVNTLSADFVVVTGDIADGTPDSKRDYMGFLSKLRAKHGVILIPGNHDYYVNFAGWKKFYLSLGLPFLDNASASYQVNGKTVSFVGLADRTGRQFGFPGPDIGKALSSAPAKDDLRILMVHRPKDSVKWADPRYGAGLILAGHTHGGQLFFLKPFVSLQNHGFVSGLYRAGTIPAYVSPGIGSWSGVPARIGAATEITLLTLK